MFSKRFATLVIFILPTLAAPSPLISIKKTENSIPGRYIVTFKGDTDGFFGIPSITSKLSPHSKVTHEWDVINGFAGNFADADLELLKGHPNVVSIEEDGYAHTQAIATQNDAPWSLGRISSQTKLTDQNATAFTFQYNYDDSAGANSDVYIIDTGILISHPAFGGRASWGATFGDYPDSDDNGHGTHCAGTAVSGPYGVAKSAKVIAVKVLNDKGNGSWSDVISGMDWVAKTAANSSRPSVASLSLGGGYTASVNSAAANLVSSGVTTVVAANNDNRDASNYSPASTPDAITVGATTIDDSKAPYSGFGSILDIWAPGSNVISTWNDGRTAFLSGTSMATPHVAGLAAYLLTLDSSLTPSSVSDTIKSKALQGVISGIPAGTTNALINNGL